MPPLSGKPDDTSLFDLYSAPPALGGRQSPGAGVGSQAPRAHAGPGSSAGDGATEARSLRGQAARVRAAGAVSPPTLGAEDAAGPTSHADDDDGTDWLLGF